MKLYVSYISDVFDFGMLKKLNRTMDKQIIPTLKTKTLTETYTVTMEPDLKTEITKLKHKFNVDTQRLLRDAIRDAVSKALKQVAS